MKINPMGRKGLSQRGFTLLELAVVVSIISILAVFALNRYYKLLVDVERTSMNHDIGVMRSAVSLQFADHYVRGDMVGLKQLIGSNPMELLAEKPVNYLGEVLHSRQADIEPGNWYFDPAAQTLVYLVKNQLYFETALEGRARARFKIFPVYSEKQQGGVKTTYLSGLTLQALEPYRWLNPWG